MIDVELTNAEKRILEKLDRQKKQISDRYNTEENQIPEYYYSNIVNAHIEVAPVKGETIGDYLLRLKIHQRIARKKNWDTHVTIGSRGKPWYSHTKNPMGCFMCEDMQFIGVLIQVLELLFIQYPKYEF